MDDKIAGPPSTPIRPVPWPSHSELSSFILVPLPGHEHFGWNSIDLRLLQFETGVRKMDIEPGQKWDMYSAREKRWVPVVVAKVDEERVTLRPKGLIEFLTVPRVDMAKPELFRPTKGSW